MLLLSIGLMSLAFFLPNPKVADPLAVGVGIWPGSETLIMARERGLLPPAQAHLMEVTWDSAGGRALANKVLDAAVFSLDEVLRMRESGQDVRVVLVLDQSLSADALVGRPGIGSVEALRGKRVGVDPRAAGMFLLVSALEKNRMKTADVVVVPTSPPDMAGALANGEVEAAVMTEPWLGRTVEGGASMLFQSQEAAVPLTRVLAARTDALARHSQQIAALVEAHFALLGELRKEGTSPGREAVFRRERTDSVAFSRSLLGIHSLNLEENRKMLSTAEPALPDMGAEVEKVLRRTGLLSRPLTERTWVDDGFLPKP